jgi:hypothetical protein
MVKPSFARGCLYGLALALPLWLLGAWLAYLAS